MIILFQSKSLDLPHILHFSIIYPPSPSHNREGRIVTLYAKVRKIIRQLSALLFVIKY